MGKFARRPAGVMVGVTAPITSTGATGATYEGGVGFARDTKSELFLLGVTNMVSEQTFYEAAADRDRRYRELVRKVAVEDPSWLVRFIPYLRETMLLRSASVVTAAEMVKVLLETGNPTKAPLRQVIDSALQRADEPGEMLAYWRSTYGRKLPQPVKRGVADAVVRLYNERAALKYDGLDRTWRMGDVIDTVHPQPKADWQGDLFKYLLDARHDRETIVVPETLGKIRLRRDFGAVEDKRALLLNAEWLHDAGATWEWASSQYGKLDADFWQAIWPSMGYMALLRNLRNFDEAKINFATKQAIIAKLADPEQVAKSRQLPIRFYSAWTFARGMDWGGALERALDLSLSNVPSLKGRSLVLVDMSGSMNGPLSGRSKINRDKAAAVFGTALALRAEQADLVQFGTGHAQVNFHTGDSLLRTVDQFRPMGGTQTVEAVLNTYHGHDRIVILTDEQAFAWGESGAFGYYAGIGYPRGEAGLKQIEAIPAPIYTFNLAGYQHGHLPSGSANRFTFGGLTDAGFKAIELLEQGTSGIWDF